MSRAIASPGAGALLGEDSERELCGLGEIGLADRSERANGREPVVVQRIDDARRQHGPRRGRGLRERVGEPEGRRTHDVVPEGRALADEVLAEEQRVVPVRGDAERLAHPDARRDAVRLVP